MGSFWPQRCRVGQLGVDRVLIDKKGFVANERFVMDGVSG
jgi:hypothetical protein